MQQSVTHEYAQLLAKVITSGAITISSATAKTRNESYVLNAQRRVAFLLARS